MLEVSRNKHGDFTQVARAMTLSGGHTKAVHGVAFNHASTRVATASADGAWCVSPVIDTDTLILVNGIAVMVVSEQFFHAYIDNRYMYYPTIFGMMIVSQNSCTYFVPPIVYRRTRRLATNVSSTVRPVQ